MDKTTFQSKFGAVYEHSPWVAEAVYKTDVEGLLGNAKKLGARFESVFLAASPDLQLATLRAHPQLVCGLADQAELTPDSVSEQKGAGLDQCSAAEHAEFVRLNAAYTKKFGFPFIIAVKGRGRDKILRLFHMRLKNDAVLEYQTALRQVCQIGKFRIMDILDV